MFYILLSNGMYNLGQKCTSTGIFGIKYKITLQQICHFYACYSTNLKKICRILTNSPHL